MNKKYKEVNILLFLLVVAAIILVIPHVVRYLYFDDIMGGDESYYHFRIAKDIIKTGIPEKDILISGNRDYIFNPYHVFLAAVILVFGSFTAKIVPFMLGISCFLLFYALLKEFEIDWAKRFFISLVFLMSPIFIYLFTTINAYSLIVLLDLFGLYLFVKNGKMLFIGSLFVFVFASMFGWFYSLVLLMALFVVSLSRKMMKRFLAASAVVIVVTSVFYFSFYFLKSVSAGFVQRNLTQQLIDGLGAKLGFSAFALVLMLVGFVVSWKMKRRLYLFYLATLVLIGFFIYRNDDVNIYLNFIFSILAGIGLYTLIRMKWELETVKTIALIVLGCGLLFSCLSQIKTVSSSLPDKEMVASLKWLNSNSVESECVFSHYSDGFWIEDIAARPVFIDSLFSYTPGINTIYEIANNISYSRRIVETKKLLNENNISYIWIDGEMKSGLVWEEDDEGLLFLFRDNETFKKIYSTDNVEIWKVINKEG